MRDLGKRSARSISVVIPSAIRSCNFDPSRLPYRPNEPNQWDQKLREKEGEIVTASVRT